VSLRVVLACSGLGRVRRGYEAFMQSCFERLRRESSVEVWLFKGGGHPGRRERVLPHLPRGGVAARLLGELTRRGPYVVEQISFAAMLLPELHRLQPHVVYYCDPAIGRLLWQWRRVSGETYRLLFHNGGPHPPPFACCDHVHQLTPLAAQDALAAGHPAERQTLLPCGFELGPTPRRLAPAERRSLRVALDLPADRRVVLGVGALNRGHKRMDYLIAEVAGLGPPRPFLLLLGEVESETPAVRATAELLLGHDGFALRTVGREEMDAYYRAADVFALASLQEAFGLAYVEALAHGLACVAHDHPVARFVMGGEGVVADLRERGALTRQLHAALALPDSDARRAARHQSVADRFGWARLLPGYLAMLERCATGGTFPRPVAVEAAPLPAAAGAGE
jgi:1,2-diacylglycerol 3-alpha-glucosyltransferase